MKNSVDFSKAKRGAVMDSTGKTRITIMLDNEVIEAFRKEAEAAGRGYQSLINEALRAHVSDASGQLERTLRRVIREELHAA